MQFLRSLRAAGILAALLVVFSMLAVSTADARMGGSFGSRGSRTFQSAPSTTTSPRITAPIQRSMTPDNGFASPGVQQPLGQPRGGLFGGFGGSLLGGLFFGGLLGMMFGHGFGGVAGGFGFIFQLLLIGGVLMFALQFFRSRPAASPTASAGPYGAPNVPPGYGSAGGSASPRNRDEIGVTNADLETFERRLREVQDGFAREDHAALRRLTTPEMVSYFSEELADNAGKGLKNEVSDLKFLQGDLAEAWREGTRDYATVAMRYSAIDVLVERTSGRIVKGDANTPTETTELWTFVRESGRDWLLSAIQEA